VLGVNGVVVWSEDTGRSDCARHVSGARLEVVIIAGGLGVLVFAGFITTVRSAATLCESAVGFRRAAALHNGGAVGAHYLKRTVMLQCTSYECSGLSSSPQRLKRVRTSRLQLPSTNLNVSLQRWGEPKSCNLQTYLPYAWYSGIPVSTKMLPACPPEIFDNSCGLFKSSFSRYSYFIQQRFRVGK
jgi:hypothetical protein